MLLIKSYRLLEPSFYSKSAMLVMKPVSGRKFTIPGEVVNDQINVLVAATDNGGTKRLKADEPMTDHGRTDDGPRTDR